MEAQTNLPALVGQRGISVEVWSALKNSLFPGAADESVLMAWDYCTARSLDVMLKPVHLVPMYIKDKNQGDKGTMRDVVMPGIGLYRIQADRAGNYAGMSAPVFGPDITGNVGGVDISYPEWCEITVSKLMGERLVSFTAREYWLENYATAGRDTKAPNSMWTKRPRGQLIKCAEAQALRKAWPELGAQPTAEEMEGKEIEREVNPAFTSQKSEAAEPPKNPPMPDETFKKNYPTYEKGIHAGRKTADDIIATLSTKYTLNDDQICAIKAISAPIVGEVIQ